MTKYQGLLSLNDRDLMLALCVREENIAEPAQWCANLRDYMREYSKESLTVEEAERLMQWGTRLAMEAGGGTDAKAHLTPMKPEVAAFNAYEAAVRNLKG